LIYLQLAWQRKKGDKKVTVTHFAGKRRTSAFQSFNYCKTARQGRLRGWAKLFWNSLPEETSEKNNNLSSNKSHRLMLRISLCLA
jgi:hypothetical protein